MKLTISEKAVAAINQLNQTALLMHRQMESGELNPKAVDKAYNSAHRKVAIWQKSQYADFGAWTQLSEFHQSGLEQKLDEANERFGRVLKHYAKAVGADFIPAE
ncbi:MAG: hypothetical protein LC768_13645 [Acidobacteria bacterium]|nr:hypothetical protein [Acidobacteriota bacterium]MCA1639354.1 hypothetical protein [Acidobacteriota bacterium]